MENRGKLSVVLDIKDQKIANEFSEAISTLEGFSICLKQISLQSADVYDILILEIGKDPKAELQLAKSIEVSGIARNVFLTSARNEPEILIEAIRAGIKEFFPQPINIENVRTAMLKIKGHVGKAKDRKAEHKGEIINVFGSNGGVGTTTVAVNLAASHTTMENPPSVALVDMKPVFGDVSTILNLDSPFSWLEATKNISRLDATYLMTILTKHHSGVYVLPAPVELPKDHRMDPNALVALLRLMQTMFDFIVIDSGQSLDRTSLEIIKISDTTLLVCELNISCILNLKKLLNQFRKFGFPEEKKTRIIVNRLVKDSEISLKDAEESLNKKIMFSIPNAYKITMNAINQGKPISAVAQGTEIWKKYRELAYFFSGNGEKEKVSKKRKGGYPLSSFFKHT